MERRSKAVGEAEAGYQQLSDIIKVAIFIPDRVGSYGFGASICRGGCWFIAGTTRSYELVSLAKKGL